MRQISERAQVTIKKTRLRILLMSPVGAITHHHDTRAVGRTSGSAAGLRAGPSGIGTRLEQRAQGGPRRPGGPPYKARLKTTTAFSPPNANEFDSAVSSME